MKRSIINFREFRETMDPGVLSVALKNFQETPEEDGMIMSNYDEEGYCLFEKVSENVYEFTGTAK